jgi:hypothetical protein
MTTCDGSGCNCRGSCYLLAPACSQGRFRRETWAGTERVTPSPLTPERDAAMKNWGKDEMRDPDEMEEPVPCGECGQWVELQKTRSCRVCGECCCPDCLELGCCTNCRDIGVL